MALTSSSFGIQPHEESQNGLFIPFVLTRCPTVSIKSRLLSQNDLHEQHASG